MYGTGYYGTGYYATGYYLRGAVDAPFGDPDPAAGFDKFWGPDEYMAMVEREDEELLLIARAFIEIIKCR
jgi:hypothetical protein